MSTAKEIVEGLAKGAANDALKEACNKALHLKVHNRLAELRVEVGNKMFKAA